jgi:hypothetical protein
MYSIAVLFIFSTLFSLFIVLGINMYINFFCLFVIVLRLLTLLLAVVMVFQLPTPFHYSTTKDILSFLKSAERQFKNSRPYFIYFIYLLWARLLLLILVRFVWHRGQLNYTKMLHFLKKHCCF